MKKSSFLLLAALLPLASHAATMHVHPTHDPAGHSGVYGEPGQPGQVTRTVIIRMNDQMRFSPARVAVQKGETVRFVIENEGKLTHEWVLGTERELNAHAAMMQAMPGMAHGDPNQVRVAPGRKRALVWHFTHAGKFPVACLVPGHREAGMKGLIIVAP